MQEGRQGPLSVERIIAERRASNARSISLTITLLGFAGVVFGAIIRMPVEHILGMGLSAIVNLGAYLIIRSGRDTAGILVLVTSTFVHHLAVVAAVGALQTVPYMATAVVLVAAATLRPRGLVAVAAMAMLVIVAEGWIVGDAAVDRVKTIGYVTGAEILLALALALTLLHIRSNDHAFEVAREQEQQRERAWAEKAELATELEKSRRIEGLGRLAGQVAHDFNNLLSGVSGSTELALMDLPDAHPARERLEEVLNTCERAARLTQQLVTLSRGPSLPPGPLDATHEIRGMRALIERLAGPSCTVELVVDDRCPHVAIERSQLEQLLVNYVVNARDAMPEGGHITIRVGPLALREAEVAQLAPGEYLEIAITDTGPGIAADILPRLFEPFFSTKQRGSGLGLATCYSIATQVGGSVLAETQPGEGATMRTLLPVSAGDGSPAPRGSLQPPAVDGARVLVVDDDEMLRRVTKKMLTHAGLEVVVAPNLAKARAVLEDGAPLAALVLDVMLGDEHGPTLLPVTRRLRPETRVVVTSGFVREPEVIASIETHAATFLPKPYTRHDLLEAVLGARAADSTHGGRVELVR